MDLDLTSHLLYTYHEMGHLALVPYCARLTFALLRLQLYEEVLLQHTEKLNFKAINITIKQ